MSENNTDLSLKTLFEDALNSYADLTTGYKDLSIYQANIKRTIAQLENVTRLVNAAQLFSSNELLEEVPTENIRYLAIPCMLGDLIGKLQSGDRLNNLEVSEIYYKDFLKRGKEYNLVPESLKLDVDNSLSALDILVKKSSDRNDKIRKYEEQKALLSDLVNLKANLEAADEEDRRRYYILFVKSLVSPAEEELRSIAMEKPLAQFREIDPDVKKKKTPKRTPVEPLRAVTIVRNDMQKKVFGLGYPSAPTMTVQEFYEERVREGIFPSGPSNYSSSLQQLEDPEAKRAAEEQDETNEDAMEEADDADELTRQRNMDEYKDNHRAGWGNRHNRS